VDSGCVETHNSRALVLINSHLKPPGKFIAAPVNLTVVTAAQRHGEFIAHLAPSAGLCEKRKWCASDGRRPQIRQACLTTNWT
jgi:hypothetical protein